MRKLLIIALTMISASAFAQLNVVSEGTAKYLFKGQNHSVVQAGECIDLIVNDIHNAGTMTIHLGDSKDQAIETYKQIGEFFKTNENKSALVVKGKDGENLTLYRHNGMYWIVTEGDQEYARQSTRDMTVKMIAGGKTRAEKKSAIPLIGYLQPNKFDEKDIADIFK